MIGIIEFINTNIKEIASTIAIVLCLLVLINITGIELNAPKPESKLVQQVTVETMNNMLDNFCESYLGNSIELEKACNQLTQTNCASVKCCVYGNGKCVAGDISGPTYKTDEDGKLITMDSYYYLGKCNGNC